MTSGPRPELRIVSSNEVVGEKRPVSARKDEDAELVRAFLAGEPAAGMEIYSLYSVDAERMLVRLLGYAPERTDLLHDVFVRVFEGMATLRDPGVLRSWICGIAVRRAQEHIRGKRRVHATLDEREPAWTGDPEVSLTMRRVYGLLDRMDADDRAAFVLRRIEGMELQEVADACGASLATIKRRVARAEKTFSDWATADAVLREKCT